MFLILLLFIFVPPVALLNIWWSLAQRDYIRLLRRDRGEDESELSSTWRSFRESRALWKSLEESAPPHPNPEVEAARLRMVYRWNLLIKVAGLTFVLIVFIAFIFNGIASS
jgi:hypothetical protein